MILDGKIAIQGLTPAALVDVVPALSLTEARKIVSTVARGGAIDGPVRAVRRTSLDALRERCHVPTLAEHARASSALDPFVKLVLSTGDGELIETVRIPLERPGRFSVCVSSQIGCALACDFCATGRLGLRRNLEAWEIVEQVRLVARELDRAARQRVHGVVFQGMGEPMANLDRVLAAIAALSEPSGLAVDARAITVCTAGMPSGIRRLAVAAPKVRLALSLGTARVDKRRSLMPIDRTHPLAESIDATIEHARTTGLAPLFALTLLDGVNDTDEDASALASLIHDFTARAGVRPRLSLIPYNRTADDETDPFRRTPPVREAEFRMALRRDNVFAHKRYSGGHDVAAACGQLASRSDDAGRL